MEFEFLTRFVFDMNAVYRNNNAGRIGQPQELAPALNIISGRLRDFLVKLSFAASATQPAALNNSA